MRLRATARAQGRGVGHRARPCAARLPKTVVPEGACGGLPVAPSVGGRGRHLSGPRGRVVAVAGAVCPPPVRDAGEPERAGAQGRGRPGGEAETTADARRVEVDKAAGTAVAPQVADRGVGPMAVGHDDASVAEASERTAAPGPPVVGAVGWAEWGAEHPQERPATPPHEPRPRRQHAAARGGRASPPAPRWPAGLTPQPDVAAVLRAAAQQNTVTARAPRPATAQKA